MTSRQPALPGHAQSTKGSAEPARKAVKGESDLMLPLREPPPVESPPSATAIARGYITNPISARIFKDYRIPDV
jgi:hypothetical protein